MKTDKGEGKDSTELEKEENQKNKWLWGEGKDKNIGEESEKEANEIKDPLSKRRIENQNDSSPKDKEPKEQDHWPDSPAQNMEDSMPPPEESSGDLHEDAAEQQPSKRNDQQPGTPKIIKAESEGEGKTSPKIHSFKNPLHI